MTRHLLRLFAPTFVAESLPNNANNYTRVIRPATCPDREYTSTWAVSFTIRLIRPSCLCSARDKEEIVNQRMQFSVRLADVERNSPIAKLEVELLHATPEQFETVANLFQLYAYDFSNFHDVVIGEDGRFAAEKLPLFWSEPNRYAFLVRFASKPAGFALVKKGSEFTNSQNVWDMAEFFVLRRYRRCGVGAEAARQIWRRLPGRWEIRVMECNSGACHFWAHAIQTVLAKSVAPARVESGDRRWYVFSFDQPCIAEKSD